MERKNITTGVLLVAAVAVWGVIVVKVVRGSRPSGVAVPRAVVEKVTVKDERDSLKLDYRDPFLGEFTRARREPVKTVAAEKPVRKEPERPPVPDFSFKGVIGGGAGRRAMVLKNGGLHMLSPGDVLGDFEVVSFSPEVMTVRSGRHVIEVKVR